MASSFLKLLLLASTAMVVAGAGNLRTAGKKLDNHQCKVTCQRFGMSSLGQEFKGMNPTECCAQCDKSYPPAGAAAALVEVSEHVDHRTNKQCKVMCQRFGMKALGGSFSAIANPTKCCDECDKVYPAATALLEDQPAHKMSQKQCKTICQRFGMKSLGKDFEKITSPTDCCAKCEEQYSE
mmetsp:Transcript_41089/g.62052  ORF Transcript_41089/g.62052 Transcript_41089/m.62052 type:complete len:181 (+) Transcript_41089:147-689(+)